MGDIEFLIAVLFAAAVLVRLADLAAIPYPIVLVVGGVAIGFVPGLPDVRLAPEVVFLVFLPPLLHAAAFNASPQELRAAAAQLVSLTFALVLVTMAAVAVVSHAVIDELSWPAAFVLGAILSPTDPVSAAAVFSRMGISERVALPVEGEAMLNDAAALTAYKVAVTATVTGTFALGPALAEFAVSAVAGVAVGLAVGWLGVRVHRHLADVPLAIFLSVLFAYGAYIGAEELGTAAEQLGIGWLHPSGVLATVTAGVWFGWHSHEMFDADTRLSGLAFWQVLVFGLNATLFVLLGLQLESVYESLRTTEGLIADVVVVSLVVIGVRLAWLTAPLLLGRAPGRLRRSAGATARERLAVGWSGMRGAISLAAALSLPHVLDSGAPFAQRDLLIFVTVGVIAITLVGQGLTLPPLLKLLGLDGEREWSPDEAIARLEAAQAALDRLDELEREERIGEERLRRMRELYRARFRRCMAVIGGDGDEARAASREPAERYAELRRELIGVERDAILGLRNEGRLRPDVMREIQRDLDLEEARLPLLRQPAVHARHGAAERIRCPDGEAHDPEVQMTTTQEPDPFGAPPTTQAGPSGPRAGFWMRFAAALLDSILVGVVSTVFQLIDPVVGTIIGIIGGIAYYTLLEGGPRGQTVGKMALGIRVIDLARGGPIGYGRAFIRYIGRIASAIVLLLGYLWMLWDKEKQTWHDKFAGSVVVPTSSYPVD